MSIYMCMYVTPKLYYITTIKKPQFQIFDTAFSTITLNYSLRTGVHQDRKNITKEQGVAVLVVCDDHHNPNKYSGCCLGFPQFKFAIDICHGDMLITDNQCGWHGNTEFYPVLKKPVNANPLYVKNDWHYNRMSFVFYYRQGIVKCSDSGRQTKKKRKM